MLILCLIVNTLLGVSGANIFNMKNTGDNIRAKHPVALELNSIGDEEFLLTKFFDIKVEGGYDNLHPDLRAVIKSQVQPDVKGQNFSGVYEIQPKMSKKPIMVLCDMETMGGGWAHIHKRFDGSQDFFLGWREYKHGFGNLNGEFWMGLENIFMLTGFGGTELLVEIVDREDVKKTAHNRTFAIGPESEGYPLRTVANYSGDAGDSMTFHLGAKFTTKDLDQDTHASNCADLCSGAWWYKACFGSNLNGKFMNIDLSEKYTYHGMHWKTFRSVEYSHSKARMLIRPA